MSFNALAGGDPCEVPYNMDENLEYLGRANQRCKPHDPVTFTVVSVPACNGHTQSGAVHPSVGNTHRRMDGAA